MVLTMRKRRSAEPELPVPPLTVNSFPNARFFLPGGLLDRPSSAAKTSTAKSPGISSTLRPRPAVVACSLGLIGD
jgi:hypothetical protein